MTFTVRDFQDLLQILKTRPDWRDELQRVLFPEWPEMRRALDALAEAQRRTEEGLQRLEAMVERWGTRTEQGFAEAAAERRRVETRMEQGFAEAAAERRRIETRMEQGFAEAAADRQAIRDEMKQGFAEAAADRQVMQRDIADLKRDVGHLKGSDRERYYRDRAAAIFGYWLESGRDAAPAVNRRLSVARKAGELTADEYRNVMAADLLWGGTLTDTGEEVVLVVEASFTVNASDVERAVTRAAILRRLGYKAIPVVAGQEWDEALKALAHRQGTAILQDGAIDEVSWQAALASA